MTAWTHQAYTAAAGREIGNLAQIAEGLEPEIEIPTCPGWTLVDLLRHVGEIHRWVTQMVVEQSPTRLRREAIDWDLPDDPHEFPGWIAAGGPALIASFAAADPDAPMWAWGADQHTRFWPRRMLHETSVHRADVEIAIGRQPAFEAAVAVDAFDELLANLPGAAYFAPRVAELRGTGERLQFVAADAGQTWDVELGPDGFVWERQSSARGRTSADVVLRLRAVDDLVLMIYGRRTLRSVDAEVTGALDVLEHWLACSAI